MEGFWSAVDERSLTPVAALRRVAFLLERNREDAYKSKAFRAAAAALGELSEAEIESRAEAGTLTELEGVGKSTAQLVSTVLAGEIPERLAKLEAESGGPLASHGMDLLGDLHSHSDWSDGTTSIAEMAQTARELGRAYQVLTDHSPRLRVANGLSTERLTRQLAVVEELNAAEEGDFRLLKGIEVDINLDGTLDQTEEMLAQLDLRVASVHSELRMPGPAMTKRMLTAIENPFTNVLGHCTGRLITGSRGTRPPSEFDAEAVFEACAKHDVAVEINARPERWDPPDELLSLAIDVGCLFSIDSDAHAPGQLDFVTLGCARAEEAGIPADRIVNTWEVERLLEWARP